MYSRFLLSVQNKYFSLGTDCNPSKLYFPLALSALYKVSANAELTQFLHSKTFYFNVCDEISNIYIPDDSRKKKINRAIYHFSTIHSHFNEKFFERPLERPDEICDDLLINRGNLLHCCFILMGDSLKFNCAQNKNRNADVYT